MHSLQKLKKQWKKGKGKSGFTLAEIAIVLALVVALSATGISIGTVYSDYEAATQGGSALKTVRQAQLAYLADHPTESYSNLPGDGQAFLNYLPDGALPVVSYKGSQVTINYNVYPPNISFNGPVPSNASNTNGTNGLWNSGP